MEKLCPHCNTWTNWEGHIDDRCNHCNQYLKEAERTDIAEKEEKRRQLEFNFQEKFPFKVREGDNFIVRIVKQTAYGIYFVFMSIMVTLLWIIFWLAS
ncbi:MAG: hypothetical protein JXQ87_05445 [Bacteroidia bacterium]